MKLLKKIIHPSLKKIDENIYERIAARAIIRKNDEILLLYTKHYDDYSFPGGGVDLHEDILEGLKRELKEEIGAVSYEIINELGLIEEYRPYNYKGYQCMHMLSYYYECELTGPLEAPELEHYEIKNGMVSKWVKIKDAIAHNENILESKPNSMGYSVERETFILKMLLEERKS
jgi:8-oxo-dGTP pyrophosphatase MutT (NUDIX family)